MSKGQRLGLIGLAAVIAAVAFVLARPDDESDKQASPAADTTREPGKAPTATTESRPEVRLQARPHGTTGVRRIETKKGEFVRLLVESDAPAEVHVHGYDITRKARPSEPARFSFRADIEGVFEVESHGEGGDSLIARLAVTPS